MKITIERKYDTLVSCNVYPLPNFRTETLYQIVSVNGMNELQILHHFQHVIRAVCINFGAENVLKCEIDIPVQEK